MLAIKDGHSIATGNIAHKTQNKDKQNYTIQKTTMMSNTNPSENRG